MTKANNRGLTEPPPAGTSMLPDDALAGEVVLITGGGTGLGLAMAVEFARTGAAIVIASRNPQHLSDGLHAIQAVGGTAYSVELDVRDPESVVAAFDRAEANLGAVSIMVNNAAGNFPVVATDLTPRGWQAVVGTVLDGTFFCSTEFARRRISAGCPGAVLNIASTGAWTGTPGTVHSAASKAAVVNLTQTLAVEWAPHGIRVNALAPGRFPHAKVLAHMRGTVPGEDHSRAPGGETIPGGRVGELHELGWAAVWMCSPFAAIPHGAHTRARRRELVATWLADARVRARRAAGRADDSDAMTREAGPTPEITSENLHFWTGGERGELSLLRCEHCATWIHPPLPRCPHCLSAALVAAATSGRATVFALTVNHRAWYEGATTPSVIAIVALPEQRDLRLLTRLVGDDPASFAIGDEVEVTFERRGPAWLPYFKRPETEGSEQ